MLAAPAGTLRQERTQQPGSDEEKELQLSKFFFYFRSLGSPSDQMTRTRLLSPSFLFFFFFFPSCVVFFLWRILGLSVDRGSCRVLQRAHDMTRPNHKVDWTPLALRALSGGGRNGEKNLCLLFRGPSRPCVGSVGSSIRKFLLAAPRVEKHGLGTSPDSRLGRRFGAAPIVISEKIRPFLTQPG